VVKAKNQKFQIFIIIKISRNLHVRIALNYEEFQPYPNQLNDNFVYDMDPTITNKKKS
jgi:hypothetical protein